MIARTRRRDDVEPDSIRVNMITVNGPMPTRGADLRAIADLYWESRARQRTARHNDLSTELARIPRAIEAIVNWHLADARSLERYH